MRVRWSETAAIQVEAIHDFIAMDNPDAALCITESLFEIADRLAQFPQMGRRRAEYGTRELVQPPFVLVYRIIEDLISIEAVFHGSQRR